jgi:hypothetical protein
MRPLLTRLLFLASSLLLLLPSVEATYKVKPKEKPPVFASAEEERLYRLRRGEILTDGGYLKRGVWGKMEGVIQAPPEIVWRLFVQANEWKNYRLPSLTDSRAVTDAIVREVGTSGKVEDVYRALGDKIVDPTANRKKGGLWSGYTFQHYDLPWPVANRWMIVKNNNDETKSGQGIYRSDWSKAAGNVRTLDGSLTLEPFDRDPDRTLLVYRIQSDPGSHVPKFLLKWGVKKTMPEVIRIVRREAAKVYGRPALLKTQ